jgi:hypothetical protein
MRTLLLPLLLVSALLAQEQDVVCRVSYVAADGLYVDAGREQGLAEGDIGIVYQEGAEIGRARVVAVSAASARLALESRSADKDPKAGDRVVFRVESERVAEPAPVPEAGPTGKKKEPGFVPLLEKQNGKAKITQKKNVAHGRISVRQLIQTGLSDYWTTIVGTSGSVDRLGGAPWTLRWSGNLSARGGDGYSDSTLEGARLDLYELSLTRRINEEGSQAKFGRFLPYQLPGAGYFDGGQAELVLSETLRIGALLGFKPTRDDLTPSADEPAGALYATITSGERGGRYFSGTFGLLGSAFDGDFDRLVALVRQRLEFGRAFRIDSTAEIDFDVGSALFRQGTRLTRFDARITTEPAKGTRLRAGVDHYEHLDTAAERDTLGGFVDALYFDRGSWRYFAGVRQQLPWDLTIDLEVAIVNSPDTDDTPHVSLGITRREIFGIPYSTLSLTVYNLEGSGADGLGGVLTAYLPLSNGEWTVIPSLGFRTFDIDSSASSFDVTNVRIHVGRALSSRWSVHVAVAHLFADGDDTTQGEIGVRYRW